MHVWKWAVPCCGMLICLCAGACLGQGASAAGEAASMVRRIQVVADKAPDCSSLKSIVETVTRGCKTNDEKAIAIYNFARLAWYHRGYPSEPGGVAALKMINVYGWSLCGGQHAALSAMWRAAGWEWRFVGWSGHTTVEVNYDDRWHYFDTFLKIYVWKADPNLPGGRTVADQADIAANPELITRDLVLDQPRKVYYHRGNQFEIINDKANWTAPAFLVCGDGPGGVVSGTQGRRRSGSPKGWAGIKFDEDGYSTDVNLGPGYSLELRWEAIEGAHWWNGRKNVPDHTCGDKDYRNCPAIGPVLEPYAAQHPRGARTFASGKLLFAPDLGNDAFLSGLAGRDNVKLAGGKLAPADPSKPASITVRLQSPYIMSRASWRFSGSFRARTAVGPPEGKPSGQISLDGGKTFKPIDLMKFDDAVGGKYDCLVKITFKGELSSLRLEAVVQHNRCALPYLSPGRNKITVSVADPKQLGENRLAVTYAYHVGHRYQTYEQLADMEAEVARAHKTRWSETPTVVQKVFTAGDLPAELTIDVPTPKDQQPLYPRMLFLRREVLSPGAKPMPLPDGAAEAKMGPNDVLKTMPNPFHIGIAAPPKKTPRPTAKRKIPLTASHVVDMAGKVYGTEQFIKWSKDNREAWVLLVAGELKDLPAARKIASAWVVLPVVSGHQEARTKIAAVALKAPFEKAKPYDFKNLGATLGTAIVPKTPADKPFDPPKEFKIDVTRGLKQIAAGELKFHGLAIRSVPDRGVDDGWTVRVNVATTVQPRLEVDVYTDK